MASSSIFKEIPPGKTCKFENNGCNKSLRPRNEVALSLFKKYIDVYCPTAASFQDSVIKLGIEQNGVLIVPNHKEGKFSLICTNDGCEFLKQRLCTLIPPSSKKDILVEYDKRP